MSQTNDKNQANEPNPGAEGGAATTRRDFLRLAGAGIGTAAAGFAGSAMAADAAPGPQDIPSIPSIRLADAFKASLAEAPVDAKFEGAGMTGAEVFAQLCKAEGLAAMFCAPGNYTIINALAAAGIPTYGGRTEGSMCAMADGFSRATGEAVATSGTEGQASRT